jgi:hypothetical protein
MRRNKWILTLSSVALSASMLSYAPQSLNAKAGIRPTYKEDDQKWKHIPNAAKSSRGGNIGFSNPFSGRSLPRLKMPKVSMPKLPGFGEPEIIGPKVITKEDNQAYMTRSGPVHLQFNGYQAQEFDRNNIPQSPLRPQRKSWLLLLQYHRRLHLRRASACPVHPFLLARSPIR